MQGLGTAAGRPLDVVVESLGGDATSSDFSLPPPLPLTALTSSRDDPLRRHHTPHHHHRLTRPRPLLPRASPSPPSCRRSGTRVLPLRGSAEPAAAWGHQDHRGVEEGAAVDSGGTPSGCEVAEGMVKRWRRFSFRGSTTRRSSLRRKRCGLSRVKSSLADEEDRGD